jgi:hypothetical protein
MEKKVEKDISILKNEEKEIIIGNWVGRDIKLSEWKKVKEDGPIKEDIF